MGSIERDQSPIKEGSVYILKHPFFHDVVKFGCTHRNPDDIARELSSKARLLGQFSVFHSIQCEDPCTVKKRVVNSLNENLCIDEFYEVAPEVALKIVQRETMRIPVVMCSQ